MKVNPDIYDKFTYVRDIEKAAELLVVLRKSLEDESICVDYDHCLNIFEKQPLLQWRLRTAFECGALHNLEGSALLYDEPPEASGPTQWPGFLSVVQILSDLRPHFEQTLSKDQYPPGPTWFPTSARRLKPVYQDFIRDLRIPHTTPLYDLPLMPLFDLGGFRNDSVLLERLNQIFVPRTNTFLVNVSGSGKSKLLYEGLCLHWGLYFTFFVDPGGLGGAELPGIARLFRKKEEFYISFSEIPVASRIRFVRDRAVCAFSEALLGQLLLFRHFLQASAKNGLKDSHKRLWTCFQLNGSLLGPQFETTRADVSAAIDQSFVDEDFVTRTIRESLGDIFALWSSVASETLFITVDEANCATDLLPIFATEEDPHGLPLLKVLLRTWHRHTKDFNVTFVVAGTRVTREYFHPNDPEWSAYCWTSNTGSFQDASTQTEYIEKFIPPAFMGIPRWPAIVRRMQRWIRGRHRFTATLAGQIILAAFSNPHLLLDNYMKVMVSYIPQDDREHQEPGFANISSGFYSLLIDKYDCKPPLFVASIHDALLALLVNLRTPLVFGYKRVSLVENAFGRFKDADMGEIVVDEPLMYIAAAQWFRTQGQSILDVAFYRKPEYKAYRQRLPTLCFMSLLLARLLSRPRPLASLLVFGEGAPAWTKQSVQLVLTEYGVTEPRMEDYVFDPDKDHGNLAFISHSTDDTLSWQKNAHAFPNHVFCIHNACSESPSLLFPLKLDDGSTFWGSLQVALNDTEEFIGLSMDDLLVDALPETVFGKPLSDISEDAISVTSSRSLRPLPNMRNDISVLPIIVPLFAGDSMLSFDDSRLSAMFNLSYADSIVSRLHSPTVDNVAAAFDNTPLTSIPKKRAGEPLENVEEESIRGVEVL